MGSTRREDAFATPDVGRTLAVGFDVSSGSAWALRWACSLARKTEGRIVVVHALGLLEHADAEHVVETIRERARSIVDEVGFVGPLDFLVAEGDPCTVLGRAVSAPVGADLVVLGTRGHEAHRGLTIGSTGHHLLEMGFIPLVIVPDEGIRDGGSGA
jgi:nucleotide-binding universal stress UspA family protein